MAKKADSLRFGPFQIREEIRTHPYPTWSHRSESVSLSTMQTLSATSTKKKKELRKIISRGPSQKINENQHLRCPYEKMKKKKLL